jgi:hypothetical protein
MAIYLKKFENHTQYETYINGGDAILPNVSICTTEGDVHYNPFVEPETRLVAKFNVTSTSSPTRIASGTTGFSKIEIDGVEQPSVTTGYTFGTTGEHIVKYMLTDPTSIGYQAFYRCSSITSVTIPNSVTSIGGSAFASCSGLTSIDIPNSVTSIGNDSFSACTSLTSIDIPNSVTSIGDSVFSNCRSITNIVIPNSVTSISDSAFTYCSSITSITIPDSVTSIGQYAFYNCSSLTSIDIPNSVTSIGGGAFRDCNGLTSITCNAVTAPTINKNTFQSIKTNGTLYVPIGSTGYEAWMYNRIHYLGYYNWTKVEQ